MSRNSGLRLAIRHYLPEAWEKVLREEKIYLQYCEYVYLSLPDYMKGNRIYCGKVGWMIGLDRLKFIFRYWNIDDCILGKYRQTFRKPIFWNKIKGRIRQYQENCK